MHKVWKVIKEVKYGNMHECVELLQKKNYIVNHWIRDIAKRTKTDITSIKFPVELIRVKVSDLGIKNPTTLKEIYNLLEKKELQPIDPLIAINARFHYDEQPKGEWLRMAVPFDSMIDSDGIPHLPKLGQGLNLLFLETYWSYPGAIFHPHNDFVVQKK
jgi:hypothetical protein|tara:strand:+ start:113 stop:589 length:477 start_codon:yes stop_codon:yes gene_type:complete